MNEVDRFYISESLAQRGGMISIVPGTIFSDHHPTILSLIEKGVSNKLRIRIPSKLLLDGKYDSQVHSIWNSAFIDSSTEIIGLAIAVSSISNFFKKEGSNEIFNYISMVRHLKTRLSSLQRLSERYHNCEWIQSNMVRATNELKYFQDQCYKYKYHKSVTTWILKGDRVTKEFFDTKRPNFGNSGVRYLSDDNGNIVSKPGKMRLLATNFFHDLLSAGESTPEGYNCREKVWSTVTVSITEEINEKLLSRSTG